MEHLHDEEIHAHLFDGQPLAPAAQAHLAGCAECRGQVAAWQRLAGELAIARRSAVSPAAEARYAALFAAVEQPDRSLAARVTAWLTATLTWDSRSQPLAAGVRGAGVAAYRLLYAGADSEVELLVEPANGTRRIIGEVMGAAEGVALVELSEGAAAEPAYAAESTPDGRFHLERVVPGRYRMTITPATGAIVEVDMLDLT
jgi:hypothetical protein